MPRSRIGLGFLVSFFILSACTGSLSARQPAGDGKLAVVATTTIVADVVKQVGGDTVQITTLLPVGADPHSFQPSPQDMAMISKAGLVFANGAGLESFLDPLIANAGAKGRVVEVSQGVTLLTGSGESAGGYDPHTWTDPNNVLVWVENIRAALNQADPQHADAYQQNADQYSTKLKDLDAWIREQIAAIPANNRKIVTDHLMFGYFADRYGMEQVGAVVPGYSTLASPSAKELAALETEIQKYGVKAIFVGLDVNANLSQRVADDTHIKLVYLYTGSLSTADGPAANYLDYMRYDVSEIITALR